MSTGGQAADSYETPGRGYMPKERRCCSFFLGRAVNNCTTVIERWRAIRFLDTLA